MALINISGIKNTPQQEHQVLGRGGGSIRPHLFAVSDRVKSLEFSPSK